MSRNSTIVAWLVVAVCCHAFALDTLTTDTTLEVDDGYDEGVFWADPDLARVELSCGFRMAIAYMKTIIPELQSGHGMVLLDERLVDSMGFSDQIGLQRDTTEPESQATHIVGSADTVWELATKLPATMCAPDSIGEYLTVSYLPDTIGYRAGKLFGLSVDWFPCRYALPVPGANTILYARTTQGRAVKIQVDSLTVQTDSAHTMPGCPTLSWYSNVRVRWATDSMGNGCFRQDVSVPEEAAAPVWSRAPAGPAGEGASRYDIRGRRLADSRTKAAQGVSVGAKGLSTAVGLGRLNRWQVDD